MPLEETELPQIPSFKSSLYPNYPQPGLDNTNVFQNLIEQSNV